MGLYLIEYGGFHCRFLGGCGKGNSGWEKRREDLEETGHRGMCAKRCAAASSRSEWRTSKAARICIMIKGLVPNFTSVVCFDMVHVYAQIHWDDGFRPNAELCSLLP